MPNIFDGFLKQIARGDNVKDYQHASRLFVTNNYERSPKYTWLFHVFFDLNPELTTIDQRQQIEAGLLVKSADLPKFRVNTKTYNNYNRPYIAQSKINYEDINITFHDDSANIIRKLWFDYYNYYYRDMDNNYGDATGSLNPVYLRNNKQITGQRNLYNKFGYTPRKHSNISTQYIQAIRIYSLHQKRFSEYTLINPTISSFRHGTHQNGGDGTMENQMSISYESVLYAGGSTRVARGFAQLHYDNSPSPLTPAGGGTNSILGPGGIVNTVDEVISDGGNGKWGSSAFKLIRGYNKNKNVDLMNLAQGELAQAFTNVLRGGSFQSALNQTYIPYRGANAGAGRGFQSALPIQTTAAPGSVASNGFNVTSGAALIGGGVATALTGIPTTGVNTNLSGVTQNLEGVITGGNLNKVIDLTKSQTNQLSAVASNPIPVNSFTSAIQAANEKLKALATSENTKVLQESLGKNASFLQQNLQSTAATFQTGTNNLVQQSSGVLANTPYKNLQVPANSQAINNANSNYFSASSPLSIEGKTSTNAEGSGNTPNTYYGGAPTI
jgi:hypothetical protein